MHKKRLIVAAVGGMLAAPAAFAQITISGQVKDGFEMYKLGAGNAGAAAASSYHYETRVSDQSSRIIFSGTQDLGGGTRAWFQLDSRFQSDVGGSTQTNTAATTGINLWAGGNTGVGLAGAWGKLTIGRWDLHYLEFIPIEFGYAGSLQDLLGAGPMAQVNGTNTGTSTSASTIANGTRTPNVIMWDSANMGGFTARVAYSTAFTTNLSGVSSNEGTGKGSSGSNGGALNAALRWSGGSLTFGASAWSAIPEGSASSRVGEQRSLRLWGGYTLGMGLKVGLGVDNSQRRQASAEAMTKRNAFMVPLAYNFGNHTAYLTLVKVGKLSGPNAAQPTDSTDATAYAMGWEYALSKLTTFGVFYAKIDNKANANYNFFQISANGATAATAGESAAQLYAGFSYRF
jgi:predicted porin